MAKLPLRILIVEDNPEDRFAYHRWLGQSEVFNAEIVDADNGQQGLQLVASCRPDCVVLDFNLPDLDGIDLILRLRQANDATAVIMLTGLNDAMTSIAAIKAGADDFLVKGQITAAKLSRSIQLAVEHRRLSHDLRQKQARLERFARLIDRSPDLLMIKQLPEGRLVEVNEAGCQQLGYTRDELLDDHFDLRTVFPEADALSQQLMGSAGEVKIDCDVITRDGRRRRYELAGQAVSQSDGVFTVLAGRDVTQLRAEVRKLSAESRVDSLTGIPNRRAFDEHLVRAWQRHKSGQSPLALLMVDVDHFKRYNDLAGHLAGDECLRRVATLVAGLPGRERTWAARYGGEEFAVLIDDCPLDVGLAAGQRLVELIRATGMAHPRAPGAVVTVSVGVAVVDTVAGTTERLVAEADKALYRAKHDGRDCVRCLPSSPAS